MAVGSDSTLQPQPGIFNRPPLGLYHILRRNNYPDTALNHDLSNALEAGPLFISVDCFLCDPQGFTCITLHFYTIYRNVHQRYRNERERNLFARP